MDDQEVLGIVLGSQYGQITPAAFRNAAKDGHEQRQMTVGRDRRSRIRPRRSPGKPNDTGNAV